MATTTTAYQGTTYVHQNGGIQVGSWTVGSTISSICLALPGAFKQLGIIFDLSSIVDEANTIAYPDRFTLYSSAATSTGKTWTLYILHEDDPEDFAGSVTENEPNQRRDANGAVVCQVTLPTLAEDEAFTFIMGQSYDGTSWSDNEDYRTEWAKFYGNWRKDSHSKKIAIVMEQTYVDDTSSDPAWHASGATTSTLRPSITVKEWGEHTGHNKAAPGDRAVYDMRTGRAVGASELMEDGYHNGIWVTDPDPEDSRRRPVDLPDTERERQDEVPT